MHNNKRYKLYVYLDCKFNNCVDTFDMYDMEVQTVPVTEPRQAIILTYFVFAKKKNDKKKINK